MKNPKILILLLAVTTMAFAGKRPMTASTTQSFVKTDTMPDICAVVTPREIDSLHIYTNRLTKSYPEPDPVEGFNACYYEFYDRDYPSLSVQLMKCETKQQAGDIFRMHMERDHEAWGSSPERLLHIADSACFTQHPKCSDKCFEAVMLVVSGRYVIWVNFRGQDNTLRDRLKWAALKIVQMLFDRIPGLAPQMIRNKQ